jgi:putative ABC transport system ATP-binding protein
VDTVVTASGIEKVYRTGRLTTPVLRGVDLEVERGECLFLVGPSGSGKTTLLSILGCVLSADAGQLTLFSDDVTRLSPTERAAFRLRRIGFVFQRFHLFDRLTAWENVRVVFELLGRRSDCRKDAVELLERVGLKDRAHHRISELSMGQRQRVALARALAADPDLILADEPTASLDAESGRNAMQLLKNLCVSLGKTIIVVTHDHRILPLADRIVTLSDGCVVSGEHPAHALRADPMTMSGARFAPVVSGGLA